MADQMKEHLKTLRSKLDGIEQLQQVEESTSVPKEIIVVGASALFALLIIIGMGVGSVTNIIGFLYPAFKSFQAIETKHKGDDTQWLVYWVIYAFFSIAETFVDYILYWIPFFYAFKLAFLFWCFMPQTKGAKMLYESFLKDFLKKNESKIDAAMADAKKNAGNVVSEVAGAGTDMAAAAASALAGSETKKDT